MKQPAGRAAAVWSMIGRGGYSDVLLAFGVVAIVSLMVFPQPLVVIDALVAVNILFGIALLLLAIYIPSPLAFTSFPSVLLLTTLFRLSLSIAITRLILLDADAGNIIETFGRLVVGGNLVVGIVVFLIITVVQFIVIAKGAERVAEVAARFTLDAMPGKQLSIDSDLRSGLIDKDDARRRRRELETESQLHGSLDGAMKFVKGDAIAGIVIIIINILGGLAIGVLQRGMSLGDAMHTYSILTIGDGLVAQIPALLASIAAGLIVTRTANDGEDKNLGEAITRQVTGHPRVLAIGGAMALVFALVPGFPWPIFIVLGLALLAAFVWRSRYEFAPLRRALRLDERAGAPQQALTASATALPAPMRLRLANDALQWVPEDEVSTAASGELQRIQEEYGVPLPPLAMHADGALPDGDYIVEAFGVRLAQGRLSQDAQSPAGAVERLVRDLCRGVQQNLAVFLGTQETSDLIQRWSTQYPALTKEMLRLVPPQRVADILRRLVDEDIPIRNLRDVFEAITDAAAREKDPVLLAEAVRVGLRRQISDRFAGPDRSVQALLAHPELEDSLRQALRNTAQGAQIAAEPGLLRHLHGEVEALRQRLGEGFAGTVVLCSMDVRQHLRRLLGSGLFDLPVLSFQELVGDLNVRPVGQLQGRNVEGNSQ